MAAGLSAAIAWKPLLRPHHHHHNKHQSFNPHTPTPASFFRTHQKLATIKFTACVLMEDPKKTASSHVAESEKDEEETVVVYPQLVPPRVAERLARKKSERLTYLITAMMSSFGITSMAVFAVYYRFAWQFQGGEIPLSEMFGTFALSVGAAVGMEFWARWAHRALWHASLWHMHEGLGITVFGMAYMFVHDGLVHRRFPVGPIANVPYFRRVAAAHKLHHSDKFNGVPYGLFLGPKEIEEVGGLEELEKEISRRTKSYNNNNNNKNSS
ncbi:beta-carotene 3-hydroxylase 1, chloroplastic [Arachis duranensis]|uniref:beta-carotene 3-hydroxylase n=1 Tax=Arachis duranensis TaxID=130453 RepID=A0A9C6TVG2_ARADU|nr:beta-carotene 3-hydroxylase 1, chloroplastic [Arachis duranensis]